MLRSTGRSIWWFVLGDALLDLDTAAAYAVLDKFLRRLVRFQKKHERPAYYMVVRESSGGLHFNIIAICTPTMAGKLRAAFTPYMVGKLAAQPMPDLDNWVRSYGVKEASSESRRFVQHLYKGSRLKGSHKLPGDGDRVTLSAALKQDGVAAGRIEDWVSSYARRSEARKPARPYCLRRKKSLDISGQLALLPLKDDTRLRYFHGGHMTAPQAREAEYQRERIGLSQYQLADAIGCSQPHYANVIRGHDPLSRITAYRLRQVLLGEKVAA